MRLENASFLSCSSSLAIYRSIGLCSAETHLAFTLHFWLMLDLKVKGFPDFVCSRWGAVDWCKHMVANWGSWYTSEARCKLNVWTNERASNVLDQSKRDLGHRYTEASVPWRVQLLVVKLLGSRILSLDGRLLVLLLHRALSVSLHTRILCLGDVKLFFLPQFWLCILRIVEYHLSFSLALDTKLKLLCVAKLGWNSSNMFCLQVNINLLLF